MRRLFVGTCPKEPGNPEGNEDQLAFSEDGSRVALCDGASESYDSKAWARLLATRHVNEPRLDGEWVVAAIQEYLLNHDFDSMSWSQQLAFERGSFATLLAAEHDVAAQKLRLVAVGDSVAILFDAGVHVESWPLSEPEQFHEAPMLLCTLPQHNAFLADEAVAARTCREFNLADFSAPVLLCMTDALGEWATRMLRDEPEALTKLLAMHSEQELIEFVAAERSLKRMRIDDSTLIVFAFDEVALSDGLSQP